MINKKIFEKLEAEIERLENYEEESVTSSDTRFGWIHGKTFALTAIRVLLDSMQKEPASERFAFKAIPRLLEMIELTDRAKAYVAKLVDALEKEGYVTDAKIVRESLMIMKGEKVVMATMDEEPASGDLEKAIDTYLTTYFGGEKEKRDWPFFKKMAIHFANWQKEQMMAKSVDSHATFEFCGFDGKPYGTITHDPICFKDFDIIDTDKVKMIIIKED